MQTFLALFRGPDIDRSVLVAASVDPDLVARFADELLQCGALSSPNQLNPDPVEAEIDSGRRRALNLVREEARAGRTARGTSHGG